MKHNSGFSLPPTTVTKIDKKTTVYSDVALSVINDFSLLKSDFLPV